MNLGLEKMTLAEAIEKSTQEGVSPRELSEVKAWLAGRYAYLGGELTRILTGKPEKWTKIRFGGEIKSDTAAERAWDATDEGKREITIRIEQKSIEKLLSAINSRLEVIRGESFNHF